MGAASEAGTAGSFGEMPRGEMMGTASEAGTAG
jgi:hypothetical protein